MAPTKDDCTRLSLLGAFSFVCVIGESDIIIEWKRDRMFRHNGLIRFPPTVDAIVFGG